MSLSRGLIGACVRNPVFANLAAVGLLVWGGVAVSKLPRETFPETSVDHVLITVPYPGADPQDAEKNISIKVEQVIEGIPGLGEISSLSTADSGKVLARFDPRITPTGELLRQIQDRVNTITTFPPEAERPIITEVIARNQVINIGVHGDAPEGTIKHIAEEIQDELMAHPDISQVSLSGVRDFEISIRLTEEALLRFGLTLQEVMDAIRSSSLDLPVNSSGSAWRVPANAIAIMSLR